MAHVVPLRLVVCVLLRESVCANDLREAKAGDETHQGESTGNIADFVQARIDVETGEIAYGSGRRIRIAIALYRDRWHVLCALYF